MSRSGIVRTFGLLLMLLALNAVSFAQRWDYLGEANVDGGIDHDRITVTGMRGEFRAIQLRVENAAIEFDRVVVHYGNGSSEPIHIRKKIPAGQSTRVIDLPGNRRVIESVEFWYSRGSWSSRKPKVRLFGMR